MPSSKVNGKQQIKEWFEGRDDIHSIVDYGAGSGTYRKLLGGDYHWIAVEIFSPYVEKYKLNDLYNVVIVADIKDTDLIPADCAIYGDVLEHLKKEEALFELEQALIYYKHVVVSIPVTEKGELSPAKVHYGNKYERHLSGWTWKEIAELANWDLRLESGGLGVFVK